MSNGFDFEMFLVRPSTLYTCGVCHNVLNNPHQCCTNSHEFCLMCITACIKNNNGCPSCRACIDKTKLSKSRILGDIIGEMAVKCDVCDTLDEKRGDDFCDWTGTLNALQVHLKTCNYNKIIDCPLYHLCCCVEKCNGTLVRKNIIPHFKEYFTEIKKTKETQVLYDAVLAKTFKFSFDSENTFDSSINFALGLKSGHGTFYYRSLGSQFTGFWVNNMKHGFGIFAGENWVYNGEWFNGIMHGYCNLETMHGSRYSGDYKNNRRDGRGTAFYPDKSVYVGEWIMGKRCGRGTYTKPDGSVYIGSFHNDFQHGLGVETKLDVTFEGFFAGGKFQGPGKLTVKNEYTYEGSFVNEEPHGIGLWTEESVMSYEGSFVKGMFSGEGVKTLESGKTFNGHFEEDRFSRGTMREADGTIWFGDFIRDVLHGTGKKEVPDISVYQGQFVNGQMHGKGLLTNCNGAIYDGDFALDMFHGNGKWFTDEFQYDGEFSKNVPHGAGLIRNCKGNYAKTDNNCVHLSIQGLTGNILDTTSTNQFDRLTYKGSFSNGWFHGMGQLNLAKFIFNGTFRYNSFDCANFVVMAMKKNCELIDLSA